MPGAFVDEAAWQAQDYKWDAYNLRAAPADGVSAKDGSGKGGQARGGTGDAKMSCQVDGCDFEVGSQKDYHSRYKICEFHLKANVVQKDGRPHRFCQQCGKFQPLEDFDGDKRSCRARLEKHNARRRRQREMAHMLRKTGTVDEKLLARKYGLKEEELAPKVARLAKAGFSVKPSPSGSGHSGGAGGGATSATRSGSRSKTGSPATSQPTAGADGSAGVVGTAAAAQAAAAADAQAQVQAQAVLLMQHMQAQQAQQAALEKAQTDAALQAAFEPLMASHLAPSQAQLAAAVAAAGAAATGARAAPATAAAPLAASSAAANLGLLLDDDFLEGVFDPMLHGLMGAGAGAPAAGNPGAAAAAFLQMDPATVMDLDDMAGLDQLLGELPALPPAARMLGGPGATWPQPPHQPAPQPAFPPTPSASEACMPLPPYLAPPALHASQHPRAAFPSLLGAPVPFGGGLQPPPPLPGGHSLRGLASMGRVDSSPSSGQSGCTLDLQHPRGPAFDEAMHLLSYDSTQVSYVPEEKLVRFSAKLFNCTPDQLPSDLKASLVNMLACQSMEGYLRPGCVHITVNALIGPEERALLAQSGARAVVERLVAAQPEAFWSQHAMLVQLGDKLVLVREGRVVHVLATAHSSLFPRVAALRPLVAQPAPEGGVEVSIWGHNLDGEGDTILARCNGAYADVERVRLVAEPAWNGLQRLDVRLAGLAGPGAVQIEIMRGGYISGSKAMLLSRDRQLAAEVRALEAEEAAGDVDTLLFQLASCEEWAAGAGRRVFRREDREVLGKSSRRLLAFAVQRKWVAATRTLLAAIAADQPASEAAANLDVMCVGTTGMPLLQLAVRSQRLELVQAVLEWGEANGHTFKSTTPGRRGLTALHLAGLVNDGGAIAGLISAKCSDALEGWERARAEDGSLPLDFARRTAAGEVVERLIATQRYKAAQAAEPVKPEACALASEAATNALKMGLARRSCADGNCHSASSSRADGCGKTPEDEPEDEVTAAKAAIKARAAEERAQSTLLRFHSPELEARYQAWFNAGQIPVDIAFLVVAILSQGAWIARWSGQSSWLGLAMLVLMAANALIMQMALLFPAAYARWREPLCVLSHVAHKMAQMAVTLVPPVGTVFSSTFNPAMALLESSSLAQVHMLSFGMKLRLGVHLVVDTFYLAAAMSANEQICAAAFPFIPGGACNLLLAAWQAVTCFAVPCALVYVSEKRSRRIFLEHVYD